MRDNNLAGISHFLNTTAFAKCSPHESPPLRESLSSVSAFPSDCRYTEHQRPSLQRNAAREPKHRAIDQITP
jgi:hypothetical protein